MIENGPRLPNFLVIGAMKAGTTSLYEYLRVHPQVFMARPKELDYFAAAKNWTRGRDWYEAQFAGADGALAVGEASPAYANDPNHPDVASRIAQLLPDVRLVYLVRHPVDRVESHYRHRVQYHQEERPAAEAIVGDPVLYLSPSRYGHQLSRYLEWFPMEQLLVIKSEDLLTSRRTTLKRVLAFLDVDPAHVPQTMDREFLKSSGAPRKSTGRRSLRRFARKRAGEPERQQPATLSSSARAMVADHLHDDVRRLQELSGEDFGCWGIT